MLLPESLEILLKERWVDWDACPEKQLLSFKSPALYEKAFSLDTRCERPDFNWKNQVFDLDSSRKGDYDWLRYMLLNEKKKNK